MGQNRIDRLFLRMAVIYGHIWKSFFREKQFLDFAKKEWSTALREFSDEVIFQAVTLCRQRFEMPPTLPQFILLCHQARPVNLKPPPDTDKANEPNLVVAEKYLQEISNILGKKGKESC